MRREDTEGTPRDVRFIEGHASHFLFSVAEVSGCERLGLEEGREVGVVEEGEEGEAEEGEGIGVVIVVERGVLQRMRE